ncbi:Phytochrome two-component sensor histidine kinase Cyanobacterial phytochrome B [Paramagnetospirillum magnetotacticum MS-1]|uniref:histidine kinase n=1 Tax=Paramagnetospirillum magnetotacticum MS-1 TaxID=272627 RepID=A0A0C2UX45_PARME|nr:ATP-binding protein [Paramagnetospirillum magnetotacticum]KIL97406.1 Phytochrome two-component sensor histidine kinase Cyanobacterial phytochrome B [Paramagnetospirillum magnetotacticum MS-1]
MHKLLEKQLRQASRNSANGTVDINVLIDLVDQAYCQNDTDMRREKRSNVETEKDLVKAYDMLKLNADEQFKKIFETVSDGIILFDKNGKIVTANNAIYKMFLHKKPSLNGRHVKFLFCGNECVKESCSLVDIKYCMDRGIVTAESMDGKKLHLSLSYGSLISVGTELYFYIVSNLTEVIEREIMLEDANILLMQSNEDLRQFAYVASHDLQTPLRNIVSYSQLLARRFSGKFGSDADEFINFIVNYSKQMSSLIGGLLEYAQTSDQCKMLQPTCADQAVSAALANLKLEIEESGADIHVGQLPDVMAEKLYLTSLFHNLIDNSIKYRSNDRDLIVRIYAQRKDGNSYQFVIEDNGTGIDSQYFDKIFIMFQRLSTSLESPGIGIGLAICRRIVHRFGGDIWVESTPNVGTKFLFTLREAADNSSAKHFSPDEESRPRSALK